jgi:AcrR family transcriptional regulator
MMMLMSVPDHPPLGLRERKKIKLRRAIQDEALRLFEAQGYEQTTVEQIADAVETSTTTFYRYFPTKEDVVLDDDFDAFAEATVATRPREEPLADSFRAAITAVIVTNERDEDRNLSRLRLIATVPALEARYASEERKTVALLARMLAGRTGRDADDYQLQLTAAAVVAALFAASHRWAMERGAAPLITLIDEAITTVAPLLTALERPTARLTR